MAMKRLLLKSLVVCLVVLLLSPMGVSATAFESSDGGGQGDGRPHRVEPEGQGTVYNVSFIGGNRILYEPMAALEGHGLGPQQWVKEWYRDNYTFIGWYDNEEGTGEPYTMDTPIYQDTTLYPKWKYAGVGGPWPRANPAGIEGLGENQNLQLGASVTITAAGHNNHLVDPPSERFRWIPTNWRVEGLEQGAFPSEAPYTATINLSTAGSYTLHITYREEVFDGVAWQSTEREHEVEELPFSVGFEFAATNNPPSSSGAPAPVEGPTSEAEPLAASSSIAASLPANAPQGAATERRHPFVPLIVAAFVLLAACLFAWLNLRQRKQKNTEPEPPSPEPHDGNE